MQKTIMFNRYIWSLYCESPRGQKTLRQAFPRFAQFAQAPGNSNWRLQLNVDIPVVVGKVEASEQPWAPADSITLRELLSIWFEECADMSGNFRRLVEGDGLYYEWSEDDAADEIYWTGFGGEEYALDVAANIGPISTVMHRLQPDAFVPYYFQGRFKQLADICMRFQISLPAMPGKLQKQERALFYLDINRNLQEFRRRHALSPTELNAFLYDFAPSCLAEDADDELPAPQRAWFLMAGVGTDADFELLDSATPQTESLWRGHRDARRGDVAILWCASPRAHLHSIWRIIEDGQDDPFAHWYSLVRIGQPQRVPHLKIKDLKANPVLAGSPMVRAHFQGCSGKYFRPDDYLALLEECARRGGHVDELPRIPPSPPSALADGEEILNERAVEIRLIEPLLEQLGFREQRDWRRQVVVRMGRGEKVYPDYVFGLVEKIDQESAQIIIESKYRIATRKDLLEAFRQGRSYALRLRTRKLVLAALEGVWLFDDTQGFSLNNSRNWTWQQLADEPVRREFRELLDYQTHR